MASGDETCILALDLGTSGPKAALVSGRGEILCHVFEETPLLLYPNGGAEQRPEDWWAAIKQATRRLLATGLVAVDDIVAISCTAQWSGTVAVGRDGSPLMNAIIWMDSRGAPHLGRIAQGPIKVAGYALDKVVTWLRLTGGLPGHAGKDPIAHILYIKNELPAIYRQTYKFLEPKDYINLRLTGKFAASYDSIALHWLTDNRNLSRVAYDSRLLAASTIDREKLPQLKQAVAMLGPITPAAADELGLNRDVQVVMGAPDVQSAAIGSGAVKDYEAHLYVGTSSWLACHVPFKKTDLLHNIASLPSAIPGRYIVSNEQQTAGACLTFLRDSLLYAQDELATGPRPADAYERLSRMAAQAPAGSGRVIFTPWLYGERTPVDDHSIRGGFYNLSLETTRQHLVRAVFEGVAYNARWLLGYVERFVKRRLDAINIVGGGATSDVWRQIYADVLGRTIRQVEEPRQANTRGAAFLAAVALGNLTFEDIPARVRIVNIHEPNPAHRRVYDDLFQEFVGIYKNNRRMFARLNAQT